MLQSDGRNSPKNVQNGYFALFEGEKAFKKRLFTTKKDEGKLKKKVKERVL